MSAFEKQVLKLIFTLLNHRLPAITSAIGGVVIVDKLYLYRLNKE